MIKNNRRLIDMLFVIVLMGVFAVSSVIIVILGINIYQKTTENTTMNFESRTSLLYISEKARQNDIKNSIRRDEVEGSNALVITNFYDEYEYETWIFFDSGYLKEVSVMSGSEVSLSDGQKIVEVSGFDITVDNNLLKLTVITSDGESLDLYLTLRSMDNEGGE